MKTYISPKKNITYHKKKGNQKLFGKNIIERRIFINTFNILKKRFIDISAKGYIKAQNTFKNSVGVTLEEQLGSTSGDFNIPDFYDIEIKAIREYFFAEFDLFNSAPDGKYINASSWISENYGYPDKDYKNIKVFKGDVHGDSISRIGLKYRFKLDVSMEEQKNISKHL